MNIRNILLFFILVLSISCEKDITLDLPQGESKVVVDGYVENGLPPYIILSRSQGYFDPIGLNTINTLPVRGAVVTISDGRDTVTLTEIDTVINGISVGGFYIALEPVNGDTLMLGTPGRSYRLDVQTPQGEQVYAEATLHYPIPLDSVWFKVQGELDSLGWAWARLSDPDTLGNCYRWFARRLNKDNFFLPPFGSAFEDKFINGRSFDFATTRGSIFNSAAEEDINEESGFYKVGDTIIVKFCTIDAGTYAFWRDAENQLGSSGSPFAVPSNVKSNIVGGLGIFSTYSASYDTIIAR